MKELSLSGHTHAASAITSGTIAAARLPSSVSNNIEIITYTGNGDTSSYRSITFSKAIRVAFNLGNHDKHTFANSAFYRNITYMSDLPTSEPSSTDYKYGWYARSGCPNYLYRSSDNKTIYFMSGYDADNAYNVNGITYFVIGIY